MSVTVFTDARSDAKLRKTTLTEKGKKFDQCCKHFWEEIHISAKLKRYILVPRPAQHTLKLLIIFEMG